MNDLEKFLEGIKCLPEDHVKIQDGYNGWTKIIYIRYGGRVLEIGFNTQTGNYSWMDIECEHCNEI